MTKAEIKTAIIAQAEGAVIRTVFAWMDNRANLMELSAAASRLREIWALSPEQLVGEILRRDQPLPVLPTKPTPSTEAAA